MTTVTLFPTLVYTSALNPSSWRGLNARLLRESLQLREDDGAGRHWSKENYPGGYTSYNSVARVHEVSPTFAALVRELDRHVAKFARSLQLDLTARPLSITDCWVNIMPHQVVHGSHLHPLATISGTYYVQTPKGSSGIKFEDPRLERMMAAPPRRQDAKPALRPWYIVPAQAGTVVLFESWLRHEVAPNPVKAERISISFNYNWF
jgi:uncharacterized protein (TIGR02466 family)